MGYINYSSLDERFKLIYKHINNESAPLALHFVQSTLQQIITAKACDCDIAFISRVLVSLARVHVDIISNNVHHAHDVLRELHYEIDSMFDV